MKIVSVNVGLPREVVWEGTTVLTGIFKEPVAGPVMISKLNLAGDKQADLTVHGGPAKAVYAYPAEHYEYWRQDLPDVSFPWGKFGENLTTSGIELARLPVGTRLAIGDHLVLEHEVLAAAQVVVAGPDQHHEVAFGPKAGAKPL